jgi:hypothetical protein
MGSPGASRGEMTPGDTESLVRVLEAYAEARIVHDLEQRLEALINREGTA